MIALFLALAAPLPATAAPIGAIAPVELVQTKRSKKAARQRRPRSTPAQRAIGGGDVTYPNCAAARAAGAAPVHRGDAGYSRKLDRDNDGVGCE